MSEATRSHGGSGWSLLRFAQSRRSGTRGLGTQDGAHGGAGRGTRPPAAGSCPAPDPAAPPPHPAFADLYQKLHGPLFRLAALLTDDPAIAETVVADAFVTLHRTLKAVSSEEGAWRYLVRLVLLRSRRARRRSDLAGGDPASGPRLCCVAGTAAGDRPSITAAMRALPQRQREAVVLVSLLEFSESEAAAAMCVRRGTLAHLLAEAQAVLAPALSARS